MRVRYPKFNAFGTVDCEIEHPSFGWLPFTASPNDVEDHGRVIFQAVKCTAAPYVVLEAGKMTPATSES